MSKDHIIETWINPLVCLEADDRFMFNKPIQLTTDAVLRYLAETDKGVPNIDEMKANYARVSTNITKLFAVPAEVMILSKIIRPLKHALGYFMIGNYLESIAMCGMVSEMAAVFLFQINELSIDGKSINNEKQASEALEEFERTPQSVRTQKLLNWNLIDEETKIKFDEIAKKRNIYLHRISANEDDIDKVAATTFNNILDIILSITGLGIGQPGKMILNPKILVYLQKKNLLS
ncbi:MAG: hypothetical protein DA330_06600 [Nitrososphaera sp.]|nr:hypothetical protein [Nitrososphaera sp.]